MTTATSETLLLPLPLLFLLLFQLLLLSLLLHYHLTGLVVKASASRVADPKFDSCLRRGDCSGSSHTSDLKIGTPEATLPGARRYKVSSETGWPGVSIGRKYDLQLLSECGSTCNCLSRSAPDIYYHVAGTLNPLLGARQAW